MLKVANQKYIRQLSWKTMRMSKTRNLIAIIAIALTTILFTAVFTIGMSLNEGIQQNNFRQVGGYSHGAFKNLTKEEFDTLKEDSLIKEWGVRRLAGMAVGKPFNKTQVEISYCNENTAKWMYCVPKKGSYPKEGTMEAAVDSYILELLGIEPVLGTEFSVTLDVDGHETTQSFILSGFWDRDEVCPAQHILIPESRLESIYAEVDVTEQNRVNDYIYSWELDVMLRSSMNIDEDMCRILLNNGYQPVGYPDTKDEISYGVNWGYTGAQMAQNIDPVVILALVMAVSIIMFTGYLIIYNVFQISVANDIRFYGMLKTIGTTPKQIKAIIRQQALLLSVAGIPIGMAFGWLIGIVLTPQIVSNFYGISNTASVNPLIFIISALFALLTVLLSCKRPGKMAAMVSPVEAVRYTEGASLKKQQRKGKKISMLSLAKANLGRTPKKTVVTMLSMALAVVLLTVTVMFASGFSIDKYVANFVVTDYVVAQTGYFNVGDVHFDDEESVSDEVIEDIWAQGGVEAGGRIYGIDDSVQQHVTEEYEREYYLQYFSEEEVEDVITRAKAVNGGTWLHRVQLYGMEPFALDQLYVAEGDLSKLYEAGNNAIAAVYHTDDYGSVDINSNRAKLGDKVTLRYIDGMEYYYEDTGEKIENIERVPNSETRPISVRSTGYRDVTYEVAAIVTVPHVLSYRFYGTEEFILNDQIFIQDSGTSNAMLYAFNVEEDAEEVMESFMQAYTETVNEDYAYESKGTYIEEFDEFRMMFLLLGGVLSFIVGIIGVLNFFNAVLTSIMSRRREFAVMQSIGMTGKQLKRMLAYEGLVYALGSVLVASGLMLVMSPLCATAFESMFWFFEYQFVIWPILLLIPIFGLLGWWIPRLVYRTVEKVTIVERLREAEN